MTFDMIEQKLLRYGTSAGVGAGTWWFLHMNKGSNITVFGQRMPVWVFGAGLGMAATIVGDVLHQYVLPHLNSNKRLQHLESAAIVPAAGAGAYVLGSKMANDSILSSLGMTEVALHGAVASFASTYIYENVMLPVVLGKPMPY